MGGGNTMYIKTEQSETQLTMDKISSQKELINEIKTLAYTLLEDILYEKDITLANVEEEKTITNLDKQNIFKLQNLFEHTEQILKNLKKENPVKIYPKERPYYELSIELDENSKLNITAGSRLNQEFPWDTLIQWFPATETDEF